MPKKHKQSKTENTGFPFVPITLTSVISTVLYFIFIALFALVSLKSSTERSLYLPVAVICGAISGFLCGFIVARITKIKGMFYGGISGFIHSLLCSLIIFTMNKGVAGNGIFILIASMVIFASLGGVAAVNIKKKIRY